MTIYELLSICLLITVNFLILSFLLLHYKKYLTETKEEWNKKLNKEIIDYKKNADKRLDQVIANNIILFHKQNKEMLSEYSIELQNQIDNFNNRIASDEQIANHLMNIDAVLKWITMKDSLEDDYESLETLKSLKNINIDIVKTISYSYNQRLQQTKMISDFQKRENIYSTNAFDRIQAENAHFLENWD